MHRKLIKCEGCNGVGYKHRSLMKHNKPNNERCFFCDKCRYCRGDGVVPAKKHGFSFKIPGFSIKF